MIVINTPVTGSQYKFTRSDNSYIEMPKGTKLIEEGTVRNKDVSDRSRGDGGIAIGDGTYKSRKMKLLYNVHSEDTDSFRESINTLEAFFREDKTPYYLVLTEYGLRSEIIVKRNKINQGDGTRNRVAIDSELDLESVRSFFESTNEYGYPGGTGSRTGNSITGGTGGTAATEAGNGVLLTAGQTITINNPGKFDVYPKYYIISQGTTVAFSLVNDTLGGGFDFESADFTSGAELVIDADAGTVYLNGSEYSSALTSGGFIKLVPGDNSIRYESDYGNITLELVWRDRVVL